jgi:hypothetical protein
LLVGAGVVIVLAITVITDLPVHSSRSQDIANERSVIKQVNADVGPCALAVREAVGLYEQEAAHTLPAADRAVAPSFLRDDQAACSFTNQTIYDLANIEVPGSAAGKHVGNVVSTATLWATSDALGAIEDVQTLTTHASDNRASNDLARRIRALASDRSEANNQVEAADRILNARLPRPNLPVVSALVPAT